MTSRGFSLLEVILALAILGGAVVVLGEVERLALRNAEFARDMACAQLLCESKLSEIVAGLASADSIQRAVIENAAGPKEPAWLYSVESKALGEEGLRSVRVTVVRDLPQQRHPVSYSLVRWIAESDTAAPERAEPPPEPDSASSGGTTPEGGR